MRLIIRSSFFAPSALGALAVAVSAQAGRPGGQGHALPRHRIRNQPCMR